ncbi:MAG: DNA polymerase III subunit beta [Patescibacteria group bacterium]|jgi:DNA polymerase-3 subunit beta
MKIVCLQENLKKSLNIAQNIIGKNLTLPILNNLLLKTEKGRLKISSTNLELGINTWASGKIEKEGEITCPAKILSNFINSLPNKKIELEAKGNILSVKCENYRASFNCLPADDFPIIPQTKQGVVFKIDGTIFRGGISQVIGLSSLSESRPEITGIFLKINKKDLKMVATDSFRLGERVIFEIEREGDSLYSLIIPQRTAQELVRILNEENGQLSVVAENNQIFFDLGNTQVISRLIDGQYPDYQQIIPKNFNITAIVDREEILNNIKIAGLFSNKSSIIKIMLQANKFEILSQDPDLGENKSQITAEIKGGPININLNYRFLIDGLNNIKTKKIFLGFNSDSTPVIIKPVGEDDYLYLIMPIKNN